MSLRTIIQVKTSASCRFEILSLTIEIKHSTTDHHTNNNLIHNCTTSFLSLTRMINAFLQKHTNKNKNKVITHYSPLFQKKKLGSNPLQNHSTPAHILFPIQY